MFGQLSKHFEKSCGFVGFTYGTTVGGMILDTIVIQSRNLYFPLLSGMATFHKGLELSQTMCVLLRVTQSEICETR